MGVVNTTYTFTATDVITSTKMNDIIDETVFDSSALNGTSLAIVSGGLQVNAAGITASNLASNAVTTTAIADSNVTTAKIADLNVTTAKLADSAVSTAKVADSAITTVKIADSNVTTAKFADANVTAAKLSGAQTGSAPVFGVRAWASFNAQANTDLSGTFSRSATTVTITATAHGLIAGNLIFLDFTAGTGTVAPDGLYEVASVTDADTFTVTSDASASGTGTVSLKRKTVRGSGNISCVSAALASPVIPPTAAVSPANGYYVANFSVAMPSANYAILGTCSETETFTTGAGDVFMSGSPYNAQSARILTINRAGAAEDCIHNGLSIIA